MAAPRLAGLLVAALVASAPARAQFSSSGVALPTSAGGVGAPPARPDPKADLAYGAYQRGYYATALKEAMKRLAANPKDGPAMTLVGEIYRDGVSVRRDPAEAARWYRLAAEAGDRQARFALGLLLLTGAEGVPKDRAAAAALFEKAAAQGHAGALYNLGVMAIEGEAILGPRFRPRGGDVPALGRGRRRRRRLFLRRAAARRPRRSPRHRRRRAWLERAADAGMIAGQVEYAIMLFNGVGVETDEAGAAKLFLKAAARNNPIAKNRLAHLYATGRGVRRDIVQAVMWNKFAEAAGIKDDELDALNAALSAMDRADLDVAMRRQAAF